MGFLHDMRLFGVVLHNRNLFILVEIDDLVLGDRDNRQWHNAVRICRDRTLAMVAKEYASRGRRS